MKFGPHQIGRAHKPFIIAEMSGNHNQSLDRALEIVEAAAKTGAQALKLQTYTADTITLDVPDKESPFFIADKESIWKGAFLYDLYKEAHTPWEWHKPIFDHARKLGMLPFSTPFDETAVDFLEDLGVAIYKIASFENNHLPLIRKVASTGKPVIMSAGMATFDELAEAVATARDAGCRDIVVLKCTSAYPATATEANLANLADMRERLGVEVGLSDHTMGIGVAIAAVALGATVIEKHFTDSRAAGGVDSAFSMEPHEMKMLVEETEKAQQAFGKIHYGPASEREENSRKYRRSIYVAEDIRAGETLVYGKNIRIVRPGAGLSPAALGAVEGKVANTDLKKGTPLSLDMVKNPAA